MVRGGGSDRNLRNCHRAGQEQEEAREIGNAQQDIFDACRQAALFVDHAHGTEKINGNVNRRKRKEHSRRPVRQPFAIEDPAGQQNDAEQKVEEGVKVDEEKEMFLEEMGLHEPGLDHRLAG